MVRTVRFWWNRRSRRTQRLVALSAALALVAVPTIWTIFPWLAQIWILWRTLVLAAWGFAAGLIVYTSDRQGCQLDEMMGELERHRRKDRKKAGDVAIGLLLQGSVLRSHDLSLDVYLPTGNEKVRVEYSSRVPLEPVEWTLPTGATGLAFASGRRVYASGESARDETYLLTEKEQAEAANLEVVAALPIRNEALRTIGVLSAYGDSNDSWIDTPEGRAEHEALAASIARLFIDVCGLATDDVTAP